MSTGPKHYNQSVAYSIPQDRSKITKGFRSREQFVTWIFHKSEMNRRCMGEDHSYGRRAYQHRKSGPQLTSLSHSTQYSQALLDSTLPDCCSCSCFFGFFFLNGLAFAAQVAPTFVCNQKNVSNITISYLSFVYGLRRKPWASHLEENCFHCSTDIQTSCK